MQIIYKITSGTAPFIASISPAAAPDQYPSELGVYSFDGLVSGHYTLTVTDAFGCEVLVNQYDECLQADLSFSSTDVSSPGLLSVGLLSSTGTLSSYIIDWHLGSTTGDIVFISGYNPNDTVNAIHPFTNEPVISGDLYAVIRYITIDGTMYSPTWGIGEYSPDLKICFNYLTVDAITCSSSTTTDNILYTHKYSYSALTDPSTDAERTINFELNNDGSTNYFAWKFITLAVADRITISYIYGDEITPSVVLEDIIVGNNVPTNDFSSIPYKYDAENFSMITDLSNISYNTGDYLQIHITPRVLEPTTFDTIWTLYFKCFSTFNNDVVPNNFNTLLLDTLTTTNDTINCNNNISIDTATSYYSSYLTDYEYFTLVDNSTIMKYNDYGDVTETFHFPYTKQYDLLSYLSIFGGCVQQVGTTNIVKSGTTITFTFSDSTDYNVYKTDYNTAISGISSFVTYSPDDSNIYYYLNWFNNVYIGSSCGDSFTTKEIYYHYSTSSIVFDDGALTITINLSSVTNNVPDLSCDNQYLLSSIVTSRINGTFSEPDFSITTSIRFNRPMVIQYPRLSIIETDIFWKNQVFLISPVNNLTTIIGDKWCYSNDIVYFGYATGRNYYILTKNALRVVINDVNDSLNNFTLYDMMNNGCPRPVSEYYTCPMLYQISGGVQIYPITTTTTSTTTTTTTTVPPISLFSFNTNIDTVQYIDFTFNSMTQPQADSISMTMGDGNRYYNIGGFSAPEINATSYSYTIPDTYLITLYGEAGLGNYVNYLDIEGVNIQDTILDLSIFNNSLNYIILYENTSNINTVQNIIFPATITDGTSIDIEYYNNLNNLNFPLWTNSPTIYLYELGSLTNLTFTNSSILGQIALDNCNAITSIDLSNCEIVIINPIISIFIQNCSLLSTVILPLVIDDSSGVGGSIPIFIRNCPSMGYIDFTTVTFVPDMSGSIDISIDLSNNSFTADIINHIVYDLDNIDFSSFQYISIDISGNNECPDTTSGGYNGSVAVASLISKGYTVNTSSCLTTTTTIP